MTYDQRRDLAATLVPDTAETRAWHTYRAHLEMWCFSSEPCVVGVRLCPFGEALRARWLSSGAAPRKKQRRQKQAP